MNLRNQEFIVIPYSAREWGMHGIFMKALKTLYPDKKLIMIWIERAIISAKRFGLFESSEPRIEERMERDVSEFAPNAPDQNPVEDVWLQGKNFCEGIL